MAMPPAPSIQLDMLAIAAHPDDVEANAGGTVLRQLAQGRKVGLLDLTKGELGTRGNAFIRTQEAEAAASLLQVTLREQLDLPDGFFSINEDSISKVAAKIAEYQPNIILTNSPHDRHPDHVRAARLVILAVNSAFLSNQMNVLPTIYNFVQDRNDKIDLIVDISLYIEKKISALKAYKSQFYNPESNEPETLISSAAFFEALREQNAFLGRRIGVRYAEGFTINRPIGLNTFTDLL
jgi:bacillithiol biosynthesis deacetylase BshB1